MKDLILSFVNPLKMKRFRFMSVFISILIFIVSVYLIALPNQIYIDNHKTDFLSQKSYVNAYLELPELALGSDFISSQYVVDENYEMVSKNSDTKPQIYKYSDIILGRLSFKSSLNFTINTSSKSGSKTSINSSSTYSAIIYFWISERLIKYTYFFLFSLTIEINVYSHPSLNVHVDPCSNITFCLSFLVAQNLIPSL